MLLVTVGYTMSVSTAQAGIFDKIGSLFGGSGTDVYAISLDNVTTGETLLKFTCDLRKNKERTCKGIYKIQKEKAFIRDGFVVHNHYTITLQGYERAPDKYDLQISDRAFGTYKGVELTNRQAQRLAKYIFTQIKFKETNYSLKLDDIQKSDGAVLTNKLVQPEDPYISDVEIRIKEIEAD